VSDSLKATLHSAVVLKVKDDLKETIMKAVILSMLMMIMTGLGQNSTALTAVQVDQEFQLRRGQEVTIQGTNLKIKFVSVLEDSRCPEDVDCVWQGNGKVKLELKEAKKNFISVIVNTGIAPKEVGYNKYTIKLVKLSPNNRSNQKIAQDQYEATLILSSAKKEEKQS
jgi:hypothetical protein